jgi:riboflavin synthase
MFTGIVREIGRVASIDADARGARLRVEAPETAPRVGIGDSVAVGGVCLTVTEVGDGTLAFDAVPETLRRTALSRLAVGAGVNLEPALCAGEPFGGHVVQGHVDGVGAVVDVTAEGDGVRLGIAAPDELLRYLVEKGSVGVDGVSLTVAALRGDGFEIALIPHTLAATTLSALSAGDPVNLEVDVLAKYVERLLEARGLR